jgi:hypothetical protein
MRNLSTALYKYDYLDLKEMEIVMEGRVLEKPDVREYDDKLSDYNTKFNEMLKTAHALKEEFTFENHPGIFKLISKLETQLKNVGDDKAEFNRMVEEITALKEFYADK